MLRVQLTWDDVGEDGMDFDVFACLGLEFSWPFKHGSYI